MTGWATHYIEKLQAGEAVSFRPKGNSMQPKIQSGQLVTVAPIGHVDEIEAGSVVLCRVRGREFLHLVKAIRREQGVPRFQIGNNQGFINGWVSKDAIFGRLVKIEP